jgi:hypothetical protein
MSAADYALPATTTGTSNQPTWQSKGIDMHHKSIPTKQDTRRGAVVLTRLGMITTSLTLVAFGPGLALAEAAWNNHNEILMTTRR